MHRSWNSVGIVTNCNDVLAGVMDERRPLLINNAPDIFVDTPTKGRGYEDAGADADTTPGEPKKRLQSLDVCRGIVMIGMILVDNQAGPDNETLAPFRESDWNGFVMADCVFPAFLFMVGMTTALAFKPLWNKQDTSSLMLWVRFLRRVILLFAIGAALNFFGRLCTHHFSKRISLCFLVVALMHMLVNPWIQRLIVALLAGAYLSVQYAVYVPNCGRGKLEPNCSAAFWIDEKVLTREWLFKQGTLGYEPQGIISTLTSILTCYIGLEFGRVLLTHKRDDDEHHGQLHTIGKWLLLAQGSIVTGLLLNYWNPLNKKLWSFSFAFASAGVAGSLMTVCYYVIDCIHLPHWTKVPLQPILWIGMNPIIVWIGMIVFESIFMYLLTPFHSQDNGWIWMFEHGFHSWIHNAQIASMLFSIANLLIWVAVAGCFYFAGIFVKL